jgi:PAS domain S-box-containing protein
MLRKKEMGDHCLRASNKILALSLISFIFAGLNSQGLQFDHFAVEDGLAQSVIITIHQDAEGFLWFGTQSGASKYDGYNFTNYFTDPNDNTSISNTWIYDIAEDDKGKIYFATKGGLNVFDKSTETFSLLHYGTLDSIIGNNFIYGLAAMENKIYLNTPPALSVYDSETGELQSYFNDYQTDGTVYDLGFPLLISSDNKVWLSSPNGLSVFDPETGEFNNIDSPRLEDRIITALYENRQKKILIGTQQGLYLVEENEGSVIPLNDINGKISNNFIRSIHQDYEGNYWIATEGGGLNMIIPDRNYQVSEIRYFVNDQGYVSHDITYSLHIDQSNNLWIGTLAGVDKTDLKKSGISIIANTEDPQSYNIMDNVVSSVYQDKSGRLWIGNWGMGLNILNANRDRNSVVYYKAEFTGTYNIPENHLHIIFEDSKGRVFIGTRNGVAIYNDYDNSFTEIHEYFGNPDFNCFKGNRVYCMEEDRHGKLWVGTGNGIIIIDFENNTIETLHADDHTHLNINSNLVYSIMEDRDGYIWIATSQGLNIVNPENDQIESLVNDPESANSLCNNFTISLREDKLGHIWIGTGSGLNRFSKKDSTFIYYSARTGLPSEIIYDIIDDKNGRLWFSTGRGIVYIDPEKAEDAEFGIVDQLRGQEFNLKAIYENDEGELFFGGMNGLYSFYPDSIRKNQYIPPVRITGIIKENEEKIESLNFRENKVVLTHKDYAFTIEFSALDYTNPEKNSYQYQLLGLSNNWIVLGNRRFVHFTNLPSGNYTFKVKGSNNDGIWNEESTSLRIMIKPPWWASSYAYAGYFIFLVLLIIAIIKFRERNLRHEKRRLKIEVEQRTAQIAREKEKAEESEQKLRSTIDSIDDIVFVLDKKGKLQEFYNPGQRKTHFIHPEDELGKPYKEIDFPMEVGIQLEAAFKTFPQKTSIIEFDHHIDIKGKSFWYNTKISPKRSANNKLTGMVIVAREITDRKEAEKKLAKQKEELKELNATKDKFFSILAHDLKNPFTNLYSMGDLLIKNFKDLDEEEKVEGLKKMHKSSEFIYQLLENLLTWSRTQRGKIEFEPGNFNPGTLAEVNVNLHKAAAENKGVKIENLVSGEHLAYGDREMINTVIRNLLNNAVKFSEEGDTIQLDLKKNKDKLTISIKDEGIGISREDQNKLFKVDEKYKSKGTAGETGTGLGLVLCKEFVEKNGGKIWCESEMGKGTIFYFSVPVGK